MARRAAATGLIVLSGADSGALGAALLAGDDGARARRSPSAWPRVVPAPLLHRGAARRPARQRGARARRGAAGRAARRCRWSRRTRCSSSAPDDYEAHEARVCIAEGEMLANPRRVKRFTREQYFKTQAQMEALFADLPSALANTVEIAKRCNLSAGARQAAAARLPDAAGRRRARADGRVLPRRLARRPRGAPGAASIPTPAARERERPRYVERLDFEIETILKMGFPGYFLIVADFINWAQEATAARSARAAARAPARWSPTRSTSPTSIRFATSCCSSASSTPSGCRCPTSTSTSARPTATASSTT